MADVRKELSFCAKTKLRVLGVVENMACSLTPPLAQLTLRDATGADATVVALQTLREKCPELLELRVALDIFPASAGGAEAMARQFGVPFLGRVPLDSGVTRAAEAGNSYTSAARLASGVDVFAPLVEHVLAATRMADGDAEVEQERGRKP